MPRSNAVSSFPLHIFGDHLSLREKSGKIDGRHVSDKRSGANCWIICLTQVHYTGSIPKVIPAISRSIRPC